MNNNQEEISQNLSFPKNTLGSQRVKDSAMPSKPPFVFTSGFQTKLKKELRIAEIINRVKAEQKEVEQNKEQVWNKLRPAGVY